MHLDAALLKRSPGSHEALATHKAYERAVGIKPTASRMRIDLSYRSIACPKRGGGLTQMFVLN